jgi:YD repeat-containing protein
LKTYRFNKIRKKNYFRYSQGRSVGSIRYEGCRTSTEYDTKGRVHSSTDALGNITIYGYDSNGIRVSAIHEANGIITKIEYLNDSQSLTGYSQVLRQTAFVQKFEMT